jgi:cell wall-associated NlpC family hydrolase
MNFSKLLLKTISVLCFCGAMVFPNFAQEMPKNETFLSIIGTGDIMLGSNYPSDAKLPANDGKDLLQNAKNILRDADVTFGNLEGCFLDSGGNSKACQSGCYFFRMPQRYVNYLLDAGFDVMNIANNHNGDFGAKGRESTVKTLQDAGLYYAGLEEVCETSIFEINGTKYGFCGFAPNTGTVRITNIDYAKKIVAGLDSLCDVVIVSFHGGAEGKEHNRVTRKYEQFYGENRGNVYEFAHSVIDAGADIVFGHGPHVLRAAELYNDRFIIYSMGNFCTAGDFNISGISGYAPAVKVLVDKEGKFVSGQIFSFLQKDKTGPVADANNAAAKEIKRLTELDFPNTALRITDDGAIERTETEKSTSPKTPIDTIQPDSDKVALAPDSVSIMQNVIEYSKKFLGLPYQRGSKGPAKFDCSGFTSYVFGNFGYQLGASCTSQIKQGQPIKLGEMRIGDLIFFKGRNARQSYAGHVGIVVSNDETGKICFIHACRRGVTIDELNKSAYYKDRYITGLRILSANL